MNRIFSMLTVAATATTVIADDAKPIAAPELTGVTEWVNSKPLAIKDLKGKVVVVHFWTHGCINCVNNYPQYKAWTKAYEKATDFAMIGIHTPEFDGEKKIDRIKAKAKDNGLTFPIAVDNDGKNWKAWGNQYWPCVYLVDKAGIVRYRWAGELREAGMKTVTAEIEKLRAETGK